MAKNDKADGSGKQTTVEEGTQFKGTLQSTCQVMVRGVVDGDLTAPSVIVSETGTVVGNVKAETIRSEGVLAGRVDADDVYLSGSVRSDTVIRAKTLEVKLQRTSDKLQVTFGECILDVGDDPGAEVSDGIRMHAPASTTQIGASASASASQTSSESAASRASDKSDKSDKSERGGPSSSSSEEPTKKHRSVPPPPS